MGVGEPGRRVGDEAADVGGVELGGDIDGRAETPESVESREWVGVRPLIARGGGSYPGCSTPIIHMESVDLSG